MMARRRNDLDIIADILRVAKNGAKKTHIVYGCNLNFNVVKKYLGRMQEHGLIEYKGKFWFATEKGRAFEDSFRKLIAPITPPPSEEVATVGT